MAKEDEGPRDKDQLVARSIAAVYVDSFLVETITDEGLLRITFGEGSAGNKGNIRFAAMIPRSDAESLAEIIQRLIKKTWKEKKETK